jgi:chromosome segregation ATPase
MDEKEKLINRLFFSTPILLVIFTIFLITMFVSGWYVFTLKDREVKLEKAAQWIERNKEIINAAKQSQARLNDLKIEVTKAEADKNIILKDITNENDKLTRTKTEENQKRAELDSSIQKIKFNQKQIAVDEAKIIKLMNEKPALEQQLKNLESQNEDLERDVSKRKIEIQRLD